MTPIGIAKRLKIKELHRGLMPEGAESYAKA